MSKPISKINEFVHDTRTNAKTILSGLGLLTLSVLGFIFALWVVIAIVRAFIALTGITS